MRPEITHPFAAAPRFYIGQKVTYTDHHNREQTGTILNLKAEWMGGNTPYIGYTVEHPSYQNRRIYLSEESMTPTTPPFGHWPNSATPQFAANAQQSKRLGNIQKAHRAWSKATFGNVGPRGPLQHLAEEAGEARQEPDNPTEYADCLFLIWDALERQAAFTLDDLLDAMEAKLTQNQRREWPMPQDGIKLNHSS